LQRRAVSKWGKRFHFHVDFGAIARGRLAGRHAAATNLSAPGKVQRANYDI
jgi:hypothetical protein